MAQGDGESYDQFDSSTQSNSNFLCELNLIIMVLSLFSLSSSSPSEEDENCINCTEEDIRNAKDHESKVATVSSRRLQTRNRDRDNIHNFKPSPRRPQRFQPVSKDSRHGRKM